MSPSAAKQFIRQFYSDMFRDLAAAERCIGPDYVDHNQEDAGRGADVFRAHVEAVLQSFPIDRISGEHIVEHWGEADTVGMLVQMGLDPFKVT